MDSVICPDDSFPVMPRAARLLTDKGTSFDSYFSTHPRCCPSRATQFTGMYSHNHGIMSNAHGYGRFAFHESALPVWLQDAGYYTAHLGKYMNGFSDRFADAMPVPPGWDETFSLSDDPYHMYGYSLMVQSPAGVTARDGTELSKPAEGPHRWRAGNSDRDYQTDVFAGIAADFIKRRKGEDAPFYLALDPTAPHTEHTEPGTLPNPRPAPRHRGRFADEALPRGQSFNERDVSDKPPALADRPRMEKEEIGLVTQRYRSRIESLLALDDLVATIFRSLEKTEQLEDTVVIYTSDNGFMAGEHRMGTGKIALYDESVRQPLVIRGPGFREGVSVAEPAGNIDLAPTIADLAGAEPLTTIDGKSLVDAPLDDESQWRAIVLENGADTGVRTQRYTYIRGADGSVELYDNVEDPFELQSLAGEPEHAETEDRMRALLERLEGCAGAACRVPADM
jgi:arylsulfatase A-like enzyme